MTDTLPALARAMLTAGDRPTVTARVVDIQGFSTWPGDEVVVVDADGVRHGRLLGVAGAARLQEAAAPLLAGDAPPALATAVVEIHGAAVEEAGLSCGGRAELLLQPTATIPAALWELLGSRTPAALLTRIDGPARRAASQVVAADGRNWGALEPPAPAAVEEAVHLLAAGHGATRRVEDAVSNVLVEAWVPAPRLVVVGSGDLVAALSTQGGLLGWEATAVDD
ncbi:MAG: hypothetical protein ACYDEN_09845, partial [Acidimicrobiales bacterium]